MRLARFIFTACLALMPVSETALSKPRNFAVLVDERQVLVAAPGSATIIHRFVPGDFGTVFDILRVRGDHAMISGEVMTGTGRKAVAGWVRTAHLLTNLDGGERRIKAIGDPRDPSVSRSYTDILRTLFDRSASVADRNGGKKSRRMRLRRMLQGTVVLNARVDPRDPGVGRVRRMFARKTKQRTGTNATALDGLRVLFPFARHRDVVLLGKWTQLTPENAGSVLIGWVEARKSVPWYGRLAFDTCQRSNIPNRSRAKQFSIFSTLDSLMAHHRGHRERGLVFRGSRLGFCRRDGELRFPIIDRVRDRRGGQFLEVVFAARADDPGWRIAWRTEANDDASIRNAVPGHRIVVMKGYISVRDREDRNQLVRYQLMSGGDLIALRVALTGLVDALRTDPPEPKDVREALTGFIARLTGALPSPRESIKAYVEEKIGVDLKLELFDARLDKAVSIALDPRLREVRRRWVRNLDRAAIELDGIISEKIPEIRGWNPTKEVHRYRWQSREDGTQIYRQRFFPLNAENQANAGNGLNTSRRGKFIWLPSDFLP